MVKKINAKIAKHRIDISELKNGNEFNDSDKMVLKKDEALSKSIHESYYESANNVSTDNQVVKIEFSVKFIVFVLVGILVFLFWTKLMPVLLVFFFAFVMASGFKPIVDWLQTKRISKIWAIAISYFTFFLFIIIIMSIVVVPLLNEVDALVREIPRLSDKFNEFMNSLEHSNIPVIKDNAGQIKLVLKDSLESLTKNLLPFLSNSLDGIKAAINTLADVAGGFITIFTAIMISIYLLNDHDYLVGSMLNRFVDYRRHKIALKLLSDVEVKLGNWIAGQLTLSLLIGLLCWIALTILGVPFALPLAVLAALLESIPSLGPIIAAIPAILIAFVDGGPNSAMYTTLAYVIIQQLEGALIVPKVMGNAVGIKAIYVLAGVMIGFALANFVGALIAIPVLVIFKIGLEFYFDLQRMKAIDKI